MTTIITAYDRNLGIGLNGGLPWKYSVDMRHFSRTTKGSVVIAGKTTAKGVFPLFDRVCVVLSKTDVKIKDSVQIRDVYETYKLFEQYPNKHFFVIGGAKTYSAFLSAGLVDTILATEINIDSHSDTFFPIYPCDNTGWIAVEENPIVGDLFLPDGEKMQAEAKIIRYKKHA